MAEVIPGVTLVRLLGRGAHASVYVGRHDGVEYAVKIVDSESDAETHDAFRREAAMLACLTGADVPQVRHVGQVGEQAYLVMDLVEGRSLRAVLDAGPLSPVMSAYIGAQLATTLAVAHRAGFVHRDLKPENVIVRENGSACLLDFGLACRVGAGGSGAGSYRYSAPEQTGMLNLPVDGRSDLYALGVMLFESLAGRPPFEAQDTAELIQAHLAKPVPRLAPLCRHLPAQLEELVLRLLAKDPEDRYQHADDVSRELRTLLDPTELAALGLRPLPRPGTGRGGGAPGTPPGPGGRLVGRESHWQLLLDRFARTRKGEGGIAVVTGAPGAGRTSLVMELAAHQAAAGAFVLTAECWSNESRPLTPLRAALNAYLAELEYAEPEERSGALGRLAAAAGDDVPTIARLSPQLAAALSVEDDEAPRPDDAPEDQEETEEQRLDAVARFVARLLSTGHVGLLVVDDVQWADPATLRVLQRLAVLLRRERGLVLATAREDAVTDVTEAMRPDTVLTVSELMAHHVAALLRDRLGWGHVSDETIERLAHRCPGNPLAAIEFLQAVLDAGLLTPEWGRWELDVERLDALNLPSDVTDLLRQRTEQLPSSGSDILTIAAAIGSRFETELVAAVATSLGHTGAGTGEAIGQALAVRLIEQYDHGYRFVHHQLREALLERLSPRDRQALHAHVATLLAARLGHAPTPEAVYAASEQVLAAGDELRPDVALDVLVRAGEVAIEEQSGDLALTYLRRAQRVSAVAHLPLGDGTATLFGRAAALSTDHSLADHYLAQAAGATTDLVRRADLMRQRAVARHMQWQGEKAGALLDQAFHELGHPLPRSKRRHAFDQATSLLGAAVLLPARRRRARTSPHDLDVAAMLAKLSATGLDGADMTLDPRALTTFSLRYLRHSAALDDGHRAAALAATGLLAQRLGRRRLGPWLILRARELVVGHGPEHSAEVDWFGALAEVLAVPVGADLGDELDDVLEHKGRWLSSANYLTGSSVRMSALLVHGWTEPAANIRHRAEARVAGADGLLGHRFATSVVHLDALAGRSQDASRQLGRIEDYLMAGKVGRGQRFNVVHAALVTAVEHGDLGDDLERACSQLARMSLDPRHLPPFAQSAWLYQAWARLDQLAERTTGRSRRRDTAVQRAGSALAALGRVADGPLLRAHHQVATASLKQLTGHNDRALRLLRDVDDAAAAMNSPLLDYEIARVRARARLELGHLGAAVQYAGQALSLARSHRWKDREQRIQREFEGLSPTYGSTRASSRSTSISWNATGSSLGSRPSAAHRGMVARGNSNDLRRQARLEAIQQVSLAATTLLDPVELASTTMAETARIFGAERAVLFLRDGDGDRLTPFRGGSVGEHELGEIAASATSMVERVRRTNEPLVISGPEEAKALGLHSAAGHGVRSAMVAPMSLGGRLVGVVYLDSQVARGVFTVSDVDALVVLTNQIALALETARAAQLELAVLAAVRERDLAETFRSATARLSATLDPTVVANELADIVRELLPADRVVLIRAGDDGSVTVAAGVSSDAVEPGPAAGTPLDPQDPGTAWLLQLVAPHLAAPQEAPPAVLGPAMHTWLAAPLVLRDRTRAVLVAGAVGDQSYIDAQVEVATAIGEQGIVALEHATLHQRTQDQAMRDALTGLANRRWFLSQAESACTQVPVVAGVMADIDHFKQVNDRYGHAVGDEVIRETAARIMAAVRTSDLVCRWGGEEFAVLLPDAHDEQALIIAQRIHDSVGERPFQTEAGPLSISVSVGLAPHVSKEAPSALLRRADEALYDAKRGGRDMVSIAGDRHIGETRVEK